MAGGFGASKSQSKQDAASQQTSVQGSQSATDAFSASRQFVDPSQVPFLSALRGAGSNLAFGQLGQIGGVANQLSGQLGGIGGELLGGLQSGAQAFAPGAETAISSLLGFTQGHDAQALRGAAGGPLAGAAELQGIAGGGGFQPGQFGPGGAGLDFQSLLEPGGALPGQIDALDVALQRNLASTLGTLGGQATLAGQTGGDRQAFLSSEAAGRSQEAFGAGASQLLAGDLAQRRQLGGVAAGLELGQRGQNILAQIAGGAQGLQGQQQQIQAAQALQGGALGQQGQNIGALTALLQGGLQGAQGAGALGLGQQQQQFGAAQAGLGSLGDLFNLGLAPFGAEFGPLQQLAQLLGGPTVLGQSFGQDRSRASSFAQSQGTSTSRGRASAQGFTFGPTG